LVALRGSMFLSVVFQKLLGLERVTKLEQQWEGRSPCRPTNDFQRYENYVRANRRRRKRLFI
jgi:hypothetical protein